MLDFFSKRVLGHHDPLANAAAAKLYVESLKQEYGAAAHDRVLDILESFDLSAIDSSVDRLEVLLTLNLETQTLHESLCAQYLMNARMPKMMENQLRGQILNYGRQFIDCYQYVLSIELNSVEGKKIAALLPLVMARMMYYQCEYARWQYLRNFNPDEVFWLNVNQLYRFAEQIGIDSVPVFLFGEQALATTLQDQYLTLQMLGLLSSGNLSIRQFNFAYQLLVLLSNRMSLQKLYSDKASFVVQLNSSLPAGRASGPLGNDGARYWSTADFVEILHGWATTLEGGRTPFELKKLLEPSFDAAFLKLLTREWAAQLTRFERSQRVPVSNSSIEVAYRLPLLHRLIRMTDDSQPSITQAQEGNFDDAANIRIYGFVTSRKRDKSTLSPSLVKGTDSSKSEARPALQKWEVENVSQTGLGVSVDALGNEWVGLGALLGFLDGSSEQDNWSLGIIRRIKRNERERIYLGIETLSRKPIAASLRPTDTRLIDPTLPPEQVWLGGHIGLFMPCNRAGKTVNALILPLSLYTLGRQFYMTAKSKHFQIALGKALEKGSDWCLVEVELVKVLEKLPITM
ncbi:hypothetical protein HZU77_012535 [Neisseriaceae bacterium TC5R-5]|nr:hypothetical protein [Neisseriaceae bacterium TC5R-5]